jgi:sec-independent protein translocase protein TatA
MEILLILGLALLFFGPTRLPALGQSLGSAVRSFKRGINGQEDDTSKQLPQASAPSSQQNPPPQA